MYIFIYKILLKPQSIFQLFLVVVILNFNPPLSFAQKTLSPTTLTVCDSLTKNPIAFATIILGKKTFMTDVVGRVSLPNFTLPTKASIAHPLYQGLEIDLNRGSNEMVFCLLKKYPFINERATNAETKLLMSKVQSFQKVNNLRFRKNYSYSTYNKVTLTPGNESKNQFDKIYKFIPKRIKRLSDNQHFLVLETTTERKVINAVLQKEVITSARSSDVSVPLLAIESSQLHSVSIYDNWIKIGGREFESPLSEKGMLHYIFNLEDTVIIEDDTLCRIKFNPIEHHYFQGLCGYMYISKRNYGIRYFDASPEEEQSKLDIQLCQSFQWVQSNWYPFETYTRLGTRQGIGKISFLANAFTQIQNLKTQPNFGNESFDETILNYPASADAKGNQPWEKIRPMPLTAADSATYKYYLEADKNKFIQKSLRLGENLYFGFFPIGKINFIMNRFVDFNKIEKVRLGFGIETNPKFSEKNKIGMYVGYGFLDKRWKYGASYSRLLKKAFGLRLETIFSHELQEAGLPNFAFDRYQFNTEVLRTYNLQIMDMNTEWKNLVTAHPIDFLDVSAGLGFSRYQNNYSYIFKGKPIAQMDFMDLLLGGRYAFGERNIQYLNHKKYLPSKYPIAYLQLTQGINAGFGSYSYSKIDFKIEQYIRFFSLGISKIQLLYTKTAGNAPYSKLFNGKGSQQNRSVIIHNSFETMRYNEFLSDEFWGLFLSHDVGKLHTPYTFSNPSLTLIHNMGVGSLSNPGDHKGLPFPIKTMEKGFVESGVFLSNLIIIRLNGLKVGLGAGLIYRYGPYASLKASENTVFKFAVTFRM